MMQPTELAVDVAAHQLSHLVSRSWSKLCLPARAIVADQAPPAGSTQSLGDSAFAIESGLTIGSMESA